MNDIFILAGEHSGDLLGEELIRAWPDEKFYGVGGPRMKSAGLETMIPFEQMQIMGFMDIILSLPKIFKMLKQIRDNILKNSPKMVILIDYQEFNARLAKSLRKHGFKGKIVQYVSPTVWAWRPKRVEFIERYYDMVLCIFPFEPKYYNNKKLKAYYVGHPLCHKISNQKYNINWKKSLLDKQHQKLLGIFPGSRKGEIKANLPLQLAAAIQYQKKHPDFNISISMANTQYLPLIENIIKQTCLIDYNIIAPEDYYDFMLACDIAIATSGTANLELALHDTPTVVTYKLSKTNYLLGKYIFGINLSYYSLPNIIYQKELFPEIIDHNIKDYTILERLESLPTTVSPKKIITEKMEANSASKKIVKLLSELLDE